MTSLDAIPDWDQKGLIPASNWYYPTSEERSPYSVPLPAIVNRFGNTAERRLLMKGLLDFRARLHHAGMTQGFQWINGSFVENIEERENRSPNDIDLVTFFYIPNGYTQQYLYDSSPDIFENDIAKDQYHVDSYFVPLNEATAEEIVKESIYWYSIWSHTRDNRWKGYLQVDLAPHHDDLARAELENMQNEERNR